MSHKLKLFFLLPSAFDILRFRGQAGLSPFNSMNLTYTLALRHSHFAHRPSVFAHHPVTTP